MGSRQDKGRSCQMNSHGDERNELSAIRGSPSSVSTNTNKIHTLPHLSVLIPTRFTLSLICQHQYQQDSHSPSSLSTNTNKIHTLPHLSAPIPTRFTLSLISQHQYQQNSHSPSSVSTNTNKIHTLPHLSALIPTRFTLSLICQHQYQQDSHSPSSVSTNTNKIHTLPHLSAPIPTTAVMCFFLTDKQWHKVQQSSPHASFLSNNFSTMIPRPLPSVLTVSSRHL